MYKCHHDSLPIIFYSFFIRNNEIHSHGTRQQIYLHVPTQQSLQSKIYVRAFGATLYNHFRTCLDFNGKIPSFKRQGKKKTKKKYLLADDISVMLN